MATLTVLCTLVGSLAPSDAAPKARPELVGRWTAPFEEGGAGAPRCERDAEGRLVCKPVGHALAALPDGRLLYYNVVEGIENVDYVSFVEAGHARDARARLLDLRSPSPVWTKPAEETGGASNPNIEPGDPGGTSDLLGSVGVPGRPGDGFVGSAWGSLGGPPHHPSNPPDDAAANDGDLFCSDIALLADGRLLIAGGSDWYYEPRAQRADGAPTEAGLAEIEGLRSTRIYDPSSGTFRQVGHMKYGRWYPSLVTLPDGKVFVASGVTKLVKSAQGSQVRRSETFDPATNTWSENYASPRSENTLPFYPRLHLMPNGKVLYNGNGEMWGPFGQAVDEAAFALQQFYNPATHQWEVTGLAPLGARSGTADVLLPMSAPFDEATVLSFGGTLGTTPGSGIATPLSVLTTVSSSGSVRSRLAGNLRHPRWFASAVALPDGTVMALNGGDRDDVIFPGSAGAVRTLEIYDPKTGAWTAMAAAARDRVYHSAAILLPDARVLSGGHAPLPNESAGSSRDVAPA